MSRCTAQIRPFTDDTTLQCEQEGDHSGFHEAVLRDYAYEGSATKISWQEEDRRTFRGLFIPCGDNDAPCMLPAGHRGNHAL